MGTKKKLAYQVISIWVVTYFLFFSLCFSTFSKVNMYYFCVWVYACVGGRRGELIFIYLINCLAVACWIFIFLILRCRSSLVVAHRLSCSLTYRILVPPPRIKPMSPALQGRFLTTGPQGSANMYYLWNVLKSVPKHI